MAKYSDKYVTIRVDSDLKKEFRSFCERSGTTVSGAINLLMEITVNKKVIPFDITTVPEIENFRVSGKKHEERINVRVDEEKRAMFMEVCKAIGIPMGRLVKMFMASCVNFGEFPFSFTDET